MRRIDGADVKQAVAEIATLGLETEARPLLLCDWNGTLVADADRARAATCAVLHSHGLPPLDIDEFRSRFRLPLTDFFADLGINGNANAALDQWNDHLAELIPEASPGAAETLEQVATAGIAIGVISASRSNVLASDVAALGFSTLVEFAIGNASSKGVLLQAITSVTGRSVTYLGDTEYDMREACAAGALAIGYGAGYRPPQTLRDAGAHTVINHLADLPELLRSHV